MKKCPLCAEEIQDEAVRCKHCLSDLSTKASANAAVVPAPEEEPRRILYEGSPSWRAYLLAYVITFVCAALVGAAGVFLSRKGLLGGAAAGPVAVLGAVALWAIQLALIEFIRRSLRVRVSNRSIETETGVLSRPIDVLELWRVRDLRYRQSLLDRLLRIAHIEIFTKDVTSPHIEIVGLPASSELFGQLRDAIEIQRQSRRVMGLVD